MIASKPNIDPARTGEKVETTKEMIGTFFSLSLLIFHVLKFCSLFDANLTRG